MRTLLKYLKHYKKESILAPLFKMLEASFELFVPLVVAGMIDTGISSGDFQYVLSMGGLLILLGLIGLVCSITAQYYAAKAAVGFGTELRSSLFAKINQLSYNEIDQIGSATFITRMTSDVNQVQNGVNMVLRLFLRSPFIVFGAMVMAFTVDQKVAGIFVVTILLLSLVIFGIMGISMPMYRRVQNQLDHITLVAKENLEGVRVIRAFNRQTQEKKEFDKASWLLFHYQRFVGRISALMNPLTYVIINLAIVWLLYVGAQRTDIGVLTQGQVVALINYMSQILVELIKLANFIVTVTKAFACANRVSSIFKVESDLKDLENTEDSSLNSEEYAVEFHQVSFAYGNSKEDVLTDLSFKVKRGQTFGIIGGTGSGKSSVVNLIPRFYDVQKGNIFINGLDVRKYAQEKLRKKIGIVPQRAVLFKGTIRENMQWRKKDASDEEIKEALMIAQAKEVVEEKKGGLDAKIMQEGRNLSGGQKQRLTIARALTGRPEILILDDSASALDFATDARLRKALREQTKDMTVFLVSQRVSSVRYADQILVLDDGKMAGLGTHKELYETCPVYREICLSQLSEREEME